MKTIINWKVFFVLWIAAILATIAVLPYALELESSILAKIKLPMPLSTLIALQITQGAILFSIMIFGGMFFANRIGLGTPILDAKSKGESVADKIRAILPISIVLGIVSTLIVPGLEFMYFQKGIELAKPTCRLEGITRIILWWHRRRDPITIIGDVVPGMVRIIHQ